VSARAGDIAVAAEHLDAERIAQILADRQARLASTRQAGAIAATRDVLRWRLGDARFGISLAAVGGVVALPALTAMPGAPREWLGVVQQRARLLNVFDPGPALGMGATGVDARCMLILRDTPKPLAIRIGAAEAIITLPMEGEVADRLLTHLPVPGDDAGLTLVSAALLARRLLAPSRPSKG
jgi:chemotaxis signal transduction protein